MRLLLLILFIVGNLFAWDGRQDKYEIGNLKGYWKFEIGDNPKWAAPDFDDTDWEEIFVPSTWEDEGFPGYDGYAWYRKEFTLHGDVEVSDCYLYVGFIDDTDETYINGHFIGFMGQVYPDYYTAAGLQRRYFVPAEYINFTGKNVIAVRVYDDFQVGGIKRGKLGLLREVSELEMDLNLSGKWKFRTGDNPDWKEKDLNDTDWTEMYVPSFWQTSGFKGYHGMAWYRKSFTIDEEFKNERLILLLGKIDDLDETYLNGHLIGKTGKIREDIDAIRLRGDEWKTLRAYYIPSDYLSYDEPNVIAVRVYDGLLHGGIYENPIGVITRQKYIRWKNETKRNNFMNFFKLFFGE